ncbi:MAG: hypothetical protein CVU38_10155 [Chloroflexi bacterium HGW-Chloroflexi-1]|nr:MAG: hypothetical protein CVU38_10155 [Chloroflexi bacterium HGW-Chloroflexi-1]
MKWLSKKLGWAIFLLLAGVFLLLKNLKVFDRRWGDGIGDGIWGGLFAAAGLGFLIWLLFNFQSGWQSHAWGAIPGFTLLSVGAMLLLEWRGIDIGQWDDAALVLFGIALGFWTMLLVQKQNWWAAIPAGVLTVVGVLLGFQERLSELGWLALFFLGLAVVFGLLYLVRAGQPDSRWAAIPAAALALLGVVTLVSAIGPTSEVLKWWPVLLLVGGLGLLLGALGRPSAVKPAVKAKTPAVKPDYSAVTPAPGTSVTADWPDEAVSPAVSPTVSPAVTPATAEETPVDLYVKKPI